MLQRLSGAVRCVNVLLCLAGASACATVTVEHPKTGEKDAGITYYEPLFLLFVSCDDKGNIKAEIKTAPDYDKPRTLRWSNGLFATAKVSATLADGWRLDAFNSEVTSQTGGILTGLGDLAAGTIGSIVGLTDRGTAITLGDGAPLLPGIYKIHWNETGAKWAEKLAAATESCKVPKPDGK